MGVVPPPPPPDVEDAVLASVRERLRGADLFVGGISVYERYGVVLRAPEELDLARRNPDHGEVIDMWLIDGRWVEGHSTGGVAGAEWGEVADGLWRVVLTGHADPDADAIEVTFAGRTHEVRIRHGCFLFAAWDVGEPPRGDSRGWPPGAAWPQAGRLVR
jgi:hypothetical protein